MHDDCDNEWLYEDLEDDAMMDLLIGDIVGENDLQQSNISNNIKSQKSMRIIRKNTAICMALICGSMITDRSRVWKIISKT